MRRGLQASQFVRKEADEVFRRSKLNMIQAKASKAAVMPFNALQISSELHEYGTCS